MNTSRCSYSFNQAIVRRPATTMVDGITSANIGPPDHQLALKQHQGYIEILENCGLKVTVLEEEPDFPDSVFVEDTAVLTPEFAVITNPKPETRSGEIHSMSKILREIYNQVYSVKSPGTLEGGDVLQINDKFFIGLTDRTNTEGANQLINFVKKHGYSGYKVSVKNLLHLKTGVSYLGDNTLLVDECFAEIEEFQNFRKILVPSGEAYAANAIRINDRVIIPEGFPVVSGLLGKTGFEVLQSPMSEFQKLDGGLSCLSLRFLK